MEETEIVSIICEHLQNKHWRFWIDDHPIHKNLEFQKHSILIGGARPDIYGFNPFNQIFAVEVKGLRDYKKAIGQALTYKSGANLSYIGGIATKLEKIKDIAIPSGLGLIPVDEATQQVGDIINPLYTIYPLYLADVKNELLVLQTQRKNNRSFASFGRTHILNFFSPIYFFDDNSLKTRAELNHDFETTNWRNQTYTTFIDGANTIGLINIENNNYFLSKIGKFCLEYFKSLNIHDIDDLKRTLNESGGRGNSVFIKFPHLAKFLQLIYFQNPDFKKFIEVLLSFEKNIIYFNEIIDKLVDDYPNLFINFFIKSSVRDEVISIFLSGDKENLKKNYNETILKYGHYNFFFAFKRHLKHLGILSEESSSYHSKTKDLDVFQDSWILTDNILI